jgi:glycosyl transferase family 25
MIPIFLINLDSSRERLAAFDKMSSRLGLPFERVSAVDASQITEDNKKVLFSFRSGYLPLGPGEMACFLSHRKVWQLIIDRGIDWAFVAEDDLHLEGTAPFFKDGAWIPPDADIVKAETARQSVVLSTDLHSTVDKHQIRQLLSYHGGSAGYFLSSGTAQLLMHETENKCDALDHVLFHKWIGIVQNLKVYQLDPAISVQDYLAHGSIKKNFVSTLTGDRSRSRTSQKLIAKPVGLAKVWREISRPFQRAGRRLVDACRNATGQAIIKRIGYVGDGNP